ASGRGGDGQAVERVDHLARVAGDVDPRFEPPLRVDIFEDALGHIFSHGAELVLGDGEIGVDGIERLDGEHLGSAVGPAGVNDVAGVDQVLPGASADGGGDAAVFEVQARLL